MKVWIKALLIILVQSPHHTNIITHAEGEMHGYKSFGDYGDGIIFHPNGISSATPIMHRAISWMDKGEEMQNGEPAPHEGYITKGEHVIDISNLGLLGTVQDDHEGSR